MRAATIVPQHYLAQISGPGHSFHMCLAHLIDEKGFEEYTEFYKNVNNLNKHYIETPYLILDNGACENKRVSIEALYRKAKLIDCDEMVLPDVLFDKEKTLELACEAIEYIRLRDNKIKLMIVPQGKNIEEMLECLNIMLEWDIQTIGIPKHLVKTYGSMGRATFIRKIGKKCRGLYIHLLGCQEDPLEVEYIKKAFPKLVRSIDSAIAYVYARDSKTLLTCERPKGAINFKERWTDQKLLKHNIDIWKEVIERSGDISGDKVRSLRI